MKGKVRQSNTSNPEIVTLECEGQSFDCVLVSGDFNNEFHFEVVFDFAFTKGSNLFISQEASFFIKNANSDTVTANLFLDVQADGIVLAKVFDSHVVLDVKGEDVETGWTQILLNPEHIHIYEYSL